jgi:hypothetical protein
MSLSVARTGHASIQIKIKMKRQHCLQKRKSDPAIAFSEKRISPLRERGGSMLGPHQHRIKRLFSKKTKERLEFYFLVIQILSLILLVLSQISFS